MCCLHWHATDMRPTLSVLLPGARAALMHAPYMHSSSSLQAGQAAHMHIRSPGSGDARGGMGVWAPHAEGWTGDRRFKDSVR